MNNLESIALSALQHYAYCPRQCALIHVEQSWTENVFTERGNRLHAKADEPEWEMLEGVRVERALPLYSDTLGLVGRADVVEFLADGTPYPVEYKSGKRKRTPDASTAELNRICDDVQLCAQALCLEEMLNTRVPRGAVFHAGSKRRREIEVNAGLRERTLEVIAAVRTILETRTTPAPVNDARCTHCSLLEACMPDSGLFKRFDPYRVEPDRLEEDHVKGMP
jgi:CRISPR-associated exonuclease Cas4